MKMLPLYIEDKTFKIKEYTNHKVCYSIIQMVFKWDVQFDRNG